MRAPELCLEAANLVGGERERTHGTKTENFGKIAVMWNAYLAIRRDPVARFDALDVGHMMVLLKIARTQLGAFNEDDWKDMVGYSACAGEVAAVLRDSEIDPP